MGLLPVPALADSITLTLACETTIGGCTSDSLGTITLVDNGEDLDLLAELLNLDGSEAGNLLRLRLNFHEFLFESTSEPEPFGSYADSELSLLALNGDGSGVEPHLVSVSLQAFNLDPSFGIKGANGLVFTPMEGHGHPNEEPVTAVPEPASLLLFGLGLAASAGRAFRRRRRTAVLVGQ
jgi:hypothetical protein